MNNLYLIILTCLVNRIFQKIIKNKINPNKKNNLKQFVIIQNNFKKMKSLHLIYLAIKLNYLCILLILRKLKV